jgi:uncharacterized Fe-S cluster protein YjdI
MVFSAVKPEGTDDFIVNPYAKEGDPKRYLVPATAYCGAAPPLGWVWGAENKHEKVAAAPSYPTLPPLTSDDVAELKPCITADDGSVSSSDSLPLMGWYAKKQRQKKGCVPTQGSKYAIATEVLTMFNGKMPSSFFRDGRKYHIHNKLVNGASYRCAHSKTCGCSARFTMTMDGVIHDKAIGHVDPPCAVKNNRVDPSCSGIPDIKEEMKQFIDCQALTFRTKLASTIAANCFTEMTRRHGGAWQGLTDAECQTRVYNTRRKEGGAAEKKKIETQHMNDGHSSFNRSQKIWIDPKSGEKQEIVMFSRKELMDRAKVRQTQVSNLVSHCMVIFILFVFTRDLFPIMILPDLC